MLIFPKENLMQNIMKTLLELFCLFMSCMNFPFFLHSNSSLLSSRINICLHKLQKCDAGRLMSPGNTFHFTTTQAKWELKITKWDPNIPCSKVF